MLDALPSPSLPNRDALLRAEIRGNERLPTDGRVWFRVSGRREYACYSDVSIQVVSANHWIASCPQDLRFEGDYFVEAWFDTDSGYPYRESGSSQIPHLVVPLPYLSLSLPGAPEPVATADNWNVTLSRSHNLTALGARVVSSGTSAVSGVDYTDIDLSISFTAGGPLAVSIPIQILPDDFAENLEQIDLRVFDVFDAIPPDQTLPLDIFDADAIEIALTPAAISEGNASGLRQFEAQLIGQSEDPFRVWISSVDGSASPFEDYTPFLRELAFVGGDGETKTFSFNVLADETPELDETIALSVQNRTNLMLVSLATPVIAIVNDDISVDVITSKSNGIAALQVGDSSTYEVTIRNATPIFSAESVHISDQLPTELDALGAWSCYPTGGASCTAPIGRDLDESVNLPPGSELRYSLITQLRQAPQDLTVENTVIATVLTGPLDRNPGNNASTDVDGLEIFSDDFD